MASYPFQSGFSPARWRLGLDAVIPKKVDNDFIEDSRTILLFELDANLNNKILGKKLMRVAEQERTLAAEQYGSRKNLAAAEQALNKVLLVRPLSSWSDAMPSTPQSICVHATTSSNTLLRL